MVFVIICVDLELHGLRMFKLSGQLIFSRLQSSRADVLLNVNISSCWW